MAQIIISPGNLRIDTRPTDKFRNTIPSLKLMTLRRNWKYRSGMNLSKHYFNIQPGAWTIILIHIVAIEPAGDYLLGTLSTNTFLDVLYSSAELLKQKKIFLPSFLKII